MLKIRKSDFGEIFAIFREFLVFPVQRFPLTRRGFAPTAGPFDRAKLFRLSILIFLLLAGCSRPNEVTGSDSAIGDAWQAFRLGDFSESAVKFQKVLNETDATKPELRLEAEYGLACIAGFGADSNEAVARPMFERIAATSPRSPWAAWARLAVVRLSQQSTGTETPEARSRLIDAYGAVVAGFPDSQAADEAYVYQQSVRLITLDPKDAIQVAKDLTGRIDRRDSHFRSALYDLRSTAYRLSGDFKSSLADAVASVDASEKDPQNPAPIDAGKLYSIAVMAQYDVGDFSTARRFYQQFLDQYPTDPRSFTVRQLLNELEKTEKSLQQASAKEIR